MEPECDGVPYVTANPISCPLHCGEVQVACEALAAEAFQIVDEESGVGTS